MFAQMPPIPGPSAPLDIATLVDVGRDPDTVGIEPGDPLIDTVCQLGAGQLHPPRDDPGQSGVERCDEFVGDVRRPVDDHHDHSVVDSAGGEHSRHLRQALAKFTGIADLGARPPSADVLRSRHLGRDRLEGSVHHNSRSAHPPPVARRARRPR